MSITIREAIVPIAAPIIPSFGKIHISTQTLVIGQTYYAGIDGILTTTPPTTGFVKIMGSAISTTDFILLMQPPIGLEE